jgi:F5/8 type C domain
MIVQRDLLLKKVTALSAILIMLVSLVSISSMGSQAANGQTNMSTCEKLPVRQVGANGARGAATAALAVDNDPATRWANQAVGSFIQLDLGKSQVLCDIDIAWYRGNVRSYNFVISTSEDGINFKDIASAASTGKTTSFERYNIPDQPARYVRVSVHGNTQNDLGSITEMVVKGHVAGESLENCTIPHINGVSAKGNDGHLPQNTLDNNANTRWSNFGFPSWIQYDLGTSQPICDVDIAWYRGNLRVNSFTISASEDGQTFQTIFSGQSTGKTTAAERYDVTDVKSKYLRITVTVNSENNNWASITEVRINAGFPPGPTPNPTDCKIPAITAVGATGNDGHLPQNTLDNNANTRWSNLGLPSSIQYDLSTSQPICDVDIAWYRGNLRVNSFTISASEDGQDFIPIFIGKSTGKTTSPEKYDVQDTDARYIRITVLSNTENNWASITGVGINGGSQTPIPNPDEICGNGIDDDKDGQIDEGCTPAPTPNEICGNGIDDDKDGQIDEGCTPGGGSGGSQTDPFGIQKIYPTKENGEEWFMDMTDGQDPRSRPPSLTKNPDGSFKVKSGQVRYGVFTSSGYQPEEVELDHGILAQRGYMQSPNDWKNVELTGYVKVNSGQSGENFAWYARGGRHTGSGSPEGCEGVAYKPGLFYDGRVRFSKEQWHVSYAFTDSKRAMDSAEDKWVGFKGIMWNMEQNGNTVVKMEIWLDKNEDSKQDGPWEKVDENIDSGGWGSEGEECGGESDQIITWGGPIATFRWDGASDVDIKNFSVREIQPPSQ